MDLNKFKSENLRHYSVKACLHVSVSVFVSASVSVKVYHCINGNGLFDDQNGYRTRSDHHHHTHNVNLTEMVTDMETETVNSGL